MTDKALSNILAKVIWGEVQKQAHHVRFGQALRVMARFNVGLRIERKKK